MKLHSYVQIQLGVRRIVLQARRDTPNPLARYRDLLREYRANSARCIATCVPLFWWLCPPWGVSCKPTACRRCFPVGFQSQTSQKMTLPVSAKKDLPRYSSLEN